MNPATRALMIVFGLCFALWSSLSLGAAAFFTPADAVWKFRLGTNEASAPVNAWRQTNFNDSTWLDARAPIYYSSATTEPPFHDETAFSGTLIAGMMDNYTSVYLRKAFVVENPAVVSELLLEAACDDGFIAWINGVEVTRYNVPAGERAFNTLAVNSVSEPAPLDTFVISNPTMLVAGTNLLAIQVFNSAISSSDLGFMAGLSAPVDVTPPVVSSQYPPAGATIGELLQVEITFNEKVLGVDAADLIVNGHGATNVTGSGIGPYLFTFPAPASGNVPVVWVANHGIRDGSSNVFPGGNWTYLIDTSFVVPLAKITEFMAANSETLADEDGDYSDWIEILNPRQSPLNLSNWCLTDNEENLSKWRFPPLVLPPGGRLVVFASGKNRTANVTKLHASFSLSGEGEYLALVMPDGVSVVSEFGPPFRSQVADTSYGAIEDTGGDAYLFAPTPGTPNSAALGAERVADTKFFPTRGLFERPFEVSITTATMGANIRYTTNGSLPSLTNGAVYTGPIPVTRSLAIRAAAFKAGCVPANVDTHTYVLPDTVLRQAPGNAAPPGWPAGSVNGQRFDYAMDPRVVDHSNTNVGGPVQVRDALHVLPSLSIVLPQSDFSGSSRGIYVNAQQRGSDWERAASVELLNDPDHGGGFHVGAGLRIRGNFSRDGNNPKHSFRLLFRSEYGDAKLRYPLYGGDAAEEFDALDVQSPQDFSWAYYDPQECNYMRDTWSRDTQGALGQPYARSRWLHLYINGIYWGIYQIEERPEATFAANYLGGESDDYDIIKNTGFSEDFHIEATDGYLTGSAGQTSAWERLFAGCRAHFAAPTDAQYFALQGLLPDGVTHTNAPDAVLLDPDNLADYLLMVMYSANHDMASSVWVGQKPNNFYGARRRGGNRGFAWIAHDGETSLDYYSNNYDRTGPVTGAIRDEFIWSNPEFFHNDLLSSPEWRMRFGDRAHRALYNGGALSPEACVARLNVRAAELQSAIIAESARWGDAQRASGPYTKADWLAKVNETRNWFTGRREFLIGQLRGDGLYPNVAAPSFNQFGGEFTPGTRITLTAPAGTIYYTLDGADPRRVGGAVSSAALAYAAPITLTRSTRMLARARVGTNWSALVEADFFPAQDFNGLHVTEIMYNPPSLGAVDGGEFEFLELKNTGPSAIDLGGCSFTGVSHRITNGTVLAPGGFLILARNATNFSARYPGVTVHGVFDGSLNNSGERIVFLRPGNSNEVLSVRFGNRAPWPLAADGHGFSLVPRDPSGPPFPEDSAKWRASAVPGGSPGANDPEPAVPRIVISEILSRSAHLTGDRIELHNPTTTPVDISGWWLSNDGAQPRKFRLPDGSVIPAEGYLNVDEMQFGNPTSATAFGLDAGGEEIYLCSGTAASANLTGWSHTASFQRTALGNSVGLVATSDGIEHWPELVANSFGASNPAPRIGPAVISEVHYSSAIGGDRFVEIQNTGAVPLPLFDPAAPTNTWRLGGVDFEFPANVMLSPGGVALIVATNPATFRARYDVPQDVPVFGPFSGRLQSSGERLQLQRPDVPDTNGVGYIIVDAVRYNERAPWPLAGSGSSLQRRNPVAFGSEPLNWIAAPATPGRVLVEEPPVVIISHPASQSVAVGESVTLSVAISGILPPFTYEWQSDSGNVATNVSDMTNDFLTFNAPNVATTQTYRVVIKNLPHSFNSVTSTVATVTVLSDSDGDGLPDQWETSHGLAIDNPSDAVFDNDSDGLTNAQEYKAGTHPANALSYLGAELNTTTGSATIQFNAISNKTYTVQYKDALSLPFWRRLGDFPARTDNRVETITGSTWTNRFYRVVTPRTP